MGFERREVETKRRVVTINYSRVRSEFTRGRSDHCLALVFPFYLISVFSYLLAYLCFSFFRFGLYSNAQVFLQLFYNRHTVTVFMMMIFKLRTAHTVSAHRVDMFLLV